MRERCTQICFLASFGRYNSGLISRNLSLLVVVREYVYTLGKVYILIQFRLIGYAPTTWAPSNCFKCMFGC